MEIQMWKEILNPYELAVEGISSGWYLLSHRAGSWQSKINIKYTWQGTEARDRYRSDRRKYT